MAAECACDRLVEKVVDNKGDAGFLYCIELHRQGEDLRGACVRVDSIAKVAEIEGAEKEEMKEKMNKMIGHGIKCFVNRQLIYNFPEELFADAGILAIEHADFDGIQLSVWLCHHVLGEAERSLHGGV
ncbi:hypothetical protein KIW84_034236 [Lathyrus oleraceus]|uniref:Uncharacterized protein n=1 Tax=Pisum sativum TaxID=3888 RepID=A0A9D4Y2A7_PEA|nr:hypothetical protein KIW84_034236 [Pisum sativum]